MTTRQIIDAVSMSIGLAGSLAILYARAMGYI